MTPFELLEIQERITVTGDLETEHQLQSYDLQSVSSIHLLQHHCRLHSSFENMISVAVSLDFIIPSRGCTVLLQT
jgi:hypothetical protein